jgi:hypothetical protein
VREVSKTSSEFSRILCAPSQKRIFVRLEQCAPSEHAQKGKIPLYGANFCSHGAHSSKRTKPDLGMRAQIRMTCQVRFFVIALSPSLFHRFQCAIHGSIALFKLFLVGSNEGPEGVCCNVYIFCSVQIIVREYVILL